jgi:hypothetical protein
VKDLVNSCTSIFVCNHDIFFHPFWMTLDVPPLLYMLAFMKFFLDLDMQTTRLQRRKIQYPTILKKVVVSSLYQQHWLTIEIILSCKTSLQQSAPSSSRLSLWFQTLVVTRV